eukprot:8929468-Lingulodinium_polyedra.AAC.1
MAVSETAEAAIPVIWRVDANAVFSPTVNNTDLDCGSQCESFDRVLSSLRMWRPQLLPAHAGPSA